MVWNTKEINEMDDSVGKTEGKVLIYIMESAI